jgi:AcrR family transcriptional regulator
MTQLSRPNPPAATTRERLMDAAVAIGAREGLAAVTTAAIARKAAAAEGTLYRHFESKDELLIAAYRRMKTEVFVTATADVDTSAPPPERLRRTWQAIYRAYRADPDAFLFGQRFMESPLAEQEGGVAAREIGRMVSDLRRDGIASGDFKRLPVDLLTSLFLAPMGYLLKAETKGRRWTRAELDAVADSVLAGWLAQRPGGA